MNLRAADVLFRSLAAVGPLLVLIPLLEARQADSGLFAIAPPPLSDTRSDQAVVRSRLVTIAAARLVPFRAPGPVAADAPALMLNLFPDRQLAARIDRVEPTASGYLLRGQVAGDADSSVALVIVDGVMAGKVAVADALYIITHVDNGVHVIQQVEQARLPPELPPVLPPEDLTQDPGPAILSDDASTIDLLVAYTPSARAAQGGTSSIQALIDLGVSETNQAYADSGVTQRLRLVHRFEVPYTESGSMSTDLSRVASTSDGHMDTVHSLRNAYGADLTQLIVNSPDACGVAYLQTSPSASFASAAFGVTHYTCVSPIYSFAHEMGHNMGLHHDSYVTGSSTGAYAYSRGYVNQAAFAPGAATNKRWRDIMAYADQCSASGFSCSRLRRFSNPSQINTGDPMGNSNSADAVRTLNQTALTVANFRASIDTSPTIAVFTDPTLIAGTTIIKAVHLTELRTRIDGVRTSRGLAAYAWTDVSPAAVVIKAAHIMEMRTALAQAYEAASRTAPTYTDSSLTNVTVKVVHIAELRAAVIALE